MPKLILKIPFSKPPSGNAAHLSTPNTATRISFISFISCICDQGNYRVAERRRPEGLCLSDGVAGGSTLGVVSHSICVTQ